MAAHSAAPVHRRGPAAGYRYELSILQAEFSLTQMLDKPVSGRMFFEQVIRDNLDIGRPDQVALVFDPTTSTPASSSTTSKGGRYAPKPPSTTPATSRSGNG